MKAEQRKNCLRAIGEAIDRVITVDVTGLWYSQSQDVLKEMYEAARCKLDGPITLAIAKALYSKVQPGDTVIINSGLTLPQGFGETDGPLGAAALARTIQHALKARIVMVTDDGLEEMISATCQGAGLSAVSLERLIELRDIISIEGTSGDKHGVGVTGFPFDDIVAKHKSVELLDLLSPSALIAVEKTGANEQGVYHSMSGLDMSRFRSRAAILFAEAKRRNIMTVGIGDGGNEIGMGTIRDVVRELVPFGRKCQCPCEGGTADSTVVDYCLPSMVSNVGAYGVAAALAALVDDPGLLHSGEIERRMTDAANASGAIDALSHYPEPTSDGLGVDAAVGILEVLRTLICALRVREWDDYRKIGTDQGL